MQNGLFSLLARTAFSLLFSLGLFSSAHGLEVGQQAPELELPGDGQSVKILKNPGKVIYLDFWASWCGPCRQSFPWMNAMQEKYKGSDFQVLGINLDVQSDEAQKFLAKVPAKFTIAYDAKGMSPRLYGVKGMPTSFLIGKDGKVIYQHIGFNNESREKLEQAIQAAIEGRK